MNPQANPNTAFQTGTDQAAINAIYTPGATQTAVTGQAPATPVAPPPQTNVTVNTSSTPPIAPETAPTATQTTSTPNTQSLTQNGSVVDLLNSAGQDSSFAARQQLAQQYGIQGYTGTAAQNTDLAKKYTDAFAANKGTTAPQTGAQASSALDNYFQQNTQTSQVDPQKNFFDQIGSMNPVVSNLYQQANQLLSSQATAQTFTQQYQQLAQNSGLQGLQTQAMNINNIMKGTEDDIRTEIMKAGGSATESQIAAMTAARNKTLLVQANSLNQQIQTQEDYINQVMQFSKEDRSAVTDQINAETGLADKISAQQTEMDNAAKDNYQKIVDTVGYTGLAAMVQGNPQQQAEVEKSLGLSKGALTNPTFLQKQDTASAGKVYGSASTGYFTYNPSTGAVEPISQGSGAGTSAGTAAERQTQAISQFQSAFVPGAKLKDGTPIIDSNGFITPLAWKQAVDDAPAEGISRSDFIKQFGHLLYKENGAVSASYGLTVPEAKLITG